MGKRGLELWLRALMLVILSRDCFINCAQLPYKGLKDTVEDGTNPAQQRRVHPDSHVMPKRRTFHLNVSSSQLMSTMEAEVLLEFRKGVTQDPFNILTDWNDTNISNYCNWTGIKCDHHTGQVSALNLSGHHLKGSISPSLDSLAFLSSLDLSDNLFEGTIPASIAKLSYLTLLQLYGNQLIGEIPSDIGFLWRLQVLSMSTNNLTGSIPASLGNCSALAYIDLDDNQLTGKVPMEIGLLSQLNWIDLAGNTLTGSIPTSLVNCSSLASVDLGSNQLTGSILSAFGQESARLLNLNLSYNSFTGAIDGYNFAPLRNLQQGLDLSHNFFSGPLPKGIGELKTIQNIDLSFNAFSGVIPGDFNECIELESLDLSSNNLDGQIPQSLPASHLTHFNVSYNNLSGSVPEPFDNFGDGSFLGNPNLCGPMLSNKCSPQGSPSLAPSPVLPSPVHSPSLAPSPVLLSPVHSSGKKSSWSALKIGLTVAGSVVALSTLVIFCVLLCCCCYKGQRRPNDDDKEILRIDHPEAPQQARPFTLSEVKAATGNFATKLGEGSYGPVYLGELPDGSEVAVKVNRKGSHQGSAEFNNEVRLLSRVHHNSLVLLVGYCEEISEGMLEQILIYEYVPNGTLAEYLHGEKQPLNWMRRLAIALKAAQGLLYLHEFCDPPIIHRDVKPTNILLDHQFLAKVADFGISKSYTPGPQTGVSTEVKGTRGYLDPEYFDTGILTESSDIYSFGVVLLELITARVPTEDNFIPRTKTAQNGNIRSIVDPALADQFNTSAMRKVAELAWTSTEKGSRPNMGEIVSGLTEAIKLENSSVKPLSRERLSRLRRTYSQPGSLPNHRGDR